MFEHTLSRLLSKSALDTEDLELIPSAAMIVDKDRVVLALNTVARDMGVMKGTPCWDSFGKCASIPEKDREFYEENNLPPAGGTKCHFCLADQAMGQQKTQKEIISVGGGQWETFWAPINEDQYLHFALPYQNDEKHS